MKIKDIIKELEQFAPIGLQEGYDNSGLQVGDPSWETAGALVCLDVTEDVLDEAIQLGYHLVIAHHPLIFKPLRSLTNQTAVQRLLHKAIKSDIGIYAIHTNIDQAFGGLNYALADMLGIGAPKVIAPGAAKLSKIITFCPAGAVEGVRNAMSEAGAGNIGNYDQCSFQVYGEGTFRAKEGANPYVGTIAELHKEPEYRLEMVVPAYFRDAVVAAIKLAHPYEEVAYDVLDLVNVDSRAGAGVWGTLSEEMTAEQFLQHVKETLKVPMVRHTSTSGLIKRVGVCGGSGAFLISQCRGLNLDAFVTADLKYHDFCDQAGALLLVDAGHYETEIVVTRLISDIITKKIPTFAVQISGSGSNPVRYS